MAGKLIPLEEAASLLGVSPDELNELRQQQKIYGYRDGANWKFKLDDVIRFKQERAGGGPSDLLGDDDEEDFLLSSDSGEGLGSSSLLDEAGVTDVPAASEPAKPAAPADDLSDEFDFDSSSDVIGIQDSGASLPPAGSSDQLLGEESGEVSARDLVPTEDVFAVAGDTFEKDEDSSSSIHDSDDEDLVLGASSESGSDIALTPGDSGISLLSKNDPGLSLDKPLDLGFDGDPLSDSLSDSTEFDSDASVEMVKGDDDFLLEPHNDAGEEESDSGSQVIALDSGMMSVLDDEALATQASGMALLEEEGAPAGGFGGFEDAGPAVGLGAAAVAATPAVMSYVPGTRFDTLSIVGLLGCTLVLSLSGIMVFDLMRNIWSWDSTFSLNSMLMDTILGLFEGA